VTGSSSARRCSTSRAPRARNRSRDGPSSAIPSARVRDESFDTVTCTLALCTIPDDGAAVAEARRVLRPGGASWRSSTCAARGGSSARVSACWSRWPSASRRLPHPRAARAPDRGAGFRIEELERSKLGSSSASPARKPRDIGSAGTGDAEEESSWRRRRSWARGGAAGGRARPGAPGAADAHLDGQVAIGRQKGSLLVVTRGGRIAHVSQRATATPDAGLAVEHDTIWRIYSMTKPITSVAAMMLYEEGALSLFDPVAKFIPAFADVRVYRKGLAVAPVTVPAFRADARVATCSPTPPGSPTAPVRPPRRRGLPRGRLRARPPPQYDLAVACDVWEPSAPVRARRRSGTTRSPPTVVAGSSRSSPARGSTSFFAQRISTRSGMTDTGSPSPSDRPRLAALYFHDPGDGNRRPQSRGPSRSRRSGRGAWSRARTGLEPQRTTTASRRCCCGAASSTGPAAGAAHRRADDEQPPARQRHPDRVRAAHADLVINEGYGFRAGLSPLVRSDRGEDAVDGREYRWEGAAGTAFWVDPARS